MPVQSETDPHRRSRQCVRNAPSRPAIFEVFAAARHRLRAEGDVAVAGWPTRADQAGGAAICGGSGVRETGRRGLPAESGAALCFAQAAAPAELRGAGLPPRGFCLVPRLCPPAVGHGRRRNRCCTRRSAAIRAETWEAVNQALLASAKADRLESGAAVRLDSTVTAALMHEPSDSTPAVGCGAGDGAAIGPCRGAARRRRRSSGATVAARPRSGPAPSNTAAGKTRSVQLYRDLIAATQASRAELQAMAEGLAESAETGRRALAR